MPQLALQQTSPPLQMFVPHGIAMSTLLTGVATTTTTAFGGVERSRRRSDSLVAVSAVAAMRRRFVMVSCVGLAGLLAEFG